MLAKLYSKLNLIKRCHKDNKGSTIVTVLVAFLFVSVLVAMTISTVAVNYKMRATDRLAKDEFYYAEKALNDIYSGLGENCALALGDAYSDTMARYKADSSNGTYPDSISAYNDFCKKYIGLIYDTTNSSSTKYGLSLAYSGDEAVSANLKVQLLEKLNSYIVGNKAEVKGIGDIVWCNKDRDPLFVSGTTEPLVAFEEANYPKIRSTIIKDVKVITKDADGIISGVTTDIVIDTPQIDFFTMNEEGLDYALAAGQGIEFNGDATINGSVYGGSKATGSIINMTKTSEYGGIVVNGTNVTINGERVVSGGDIYVDSFKDDVSGIIKSGHLVIKNDTKNEIWFDNLVVTGDYALSDSTPIGTSDEDTNDVYIEGDLYAQGDLQVERNNSKVKIAGNYYGYNSGSFDSKADALTDENGKAIVNKSNKFSAVVVNALKSKVDMSKLENLVVLGKAYINHTKGAKDMENNPNNTTPAEPNNAVVLSDGEPNDTGVGESVALKYGQELFLVPTEFLNGSSNPTVYKKEGFEFTINKEEMEKWFGWNYLDHNTGGVSGAIPEIQTVKLVSNGVYRAYCYLKFESETKQREFVEYVVDYDDTKAADIANKGTVEPFPLTLQKRHKDLLETQGTDVLVGDTGTKVYSNGAIVEYRDDTVSTVKDTNNIDRFGGYGAGMHKKYQYLCTYLDSMKNTPVSSSILLDVDSGDFEDTEYPFAKLFWTWGIRKALGPGESMCSGKCGGNCTEKCGEGDEFGSKVIVVRGFGPDTPVDLADIWQKHGHPANCFIIVEGSAYIKADMTIKGFIYVKDKLTVNEGVKLSVTYDSTLLDRRIEGERNALDASFREALANASLGESVDETVKKVYNDGNSYVTDDDYKESLTYLIRYILDTTTPKDGSAIVSGDRGDNIQYSDINSKRKYKLNTEEKQIVNDVTSDYTQFMYFENWKKGL